MKNTPHQPTREEKTQLTEQKLATQPHLVEFLVDRHVSPWLDPQRRHRPGERRALFDWNFARAGVARCRKFGSSAAFRFPEDGQDYEKTSWKRNSTVLCLFLTWHYLGVDSKLIHNFDPI